MMLDQLEPWYVTKDGNLVALNSSYSEQSDKIQGTLGGQQQGVAKGLLEPAILLFDEPTSALDPEMINKF